VRGYKLEKKLQIAKIRKATNNIRTRIKMLLRRVRAPVKISKVSRKTRSLSITWAAQSAVIRSSMRSELPKTSFN
jgi:hypothetical protein